MGQNLFLSAERRKITNNPSTAMKFAEYNDFKKSGKYRRYMNNDKEYAEYLNELSDAYFKTLPTASDYNMLCDKMLELYSAKKDGTAMFYQDSNSTVHLCFTELKSTNINILLSFNTESDGIREILDNLFNFSGNTNSYPKLYSWPVTFVFNYSLPVAPSLLRTILAAQYCKDNNIELYNRFTIPKKNGKVRVIYAPDERIKSPLREMNAVLQNAYDERNSDFQVAYKKGKNIVSNAVIHKDNQYIYKIDIKDFFPSCKSDRVYKYVKFLVSEKCAEKYIIDKLLEVITVDGGLFIGSPVSGTIANAIMSSPVAYIKKMCDKVEMGFSVYADDMTFSSSKFIKKDFILNMVNKAFSEYGLDNDFKIHPDKCIGQSKNIRHITGVGFNQNNEPVIKTKRYREIRAALHHLSYGDTSVNIKKLKGNLAFTNMIDHTDKMKRLLSKYHDVLVKYKLIKEE